MRYIFFLFLSFNTFSATTFDLTDPSNLDISNIYPEYELMQIVNFDDTNNGYSIIGFKIKKSNENWDLYFSASISHGKDGTQRIYITLPKVCTDKEENFEAVILKTNGQNLLYNKFCDGTNEYMTPRTSAGHKFLETEFIRKEFVRIEFSDITVIFSATGFTKAWNSKGGNAL